MHGWRRARVAATGAVAVVASGLVLAACGGSSSSSGATTAESGDGEPLAASGLRVAPLPASLEALSGSFAKHVDVFGVDIVATEATPDEKVLHAANVMAQYLDNDADGAPDDDRVVQAMNANSATLVMAATPEEFEALDQEAVFSVVGSGGQDLYASETDPSEGFDGSLEEVHHLILNTGWSEVFPDVLAQEPGSELAAAMDIARGGSFGTVPTAYPPGAWFTYDDTTCDYRCQLSEYAYWAHTSLLGGQTGRSAEIGEEWRLETPEKVRAGDPAATEIFTDPAKRLPTALPDGDYRG